MIEKLFENNKGVLAIDERESSIVKKLEKFGEMVVRKINIENYC